jgi:hypothetical protein
LAVRDSPPKLRPKTILTEVYDEPDESLVIAKKKIRQVCKRSGNHGEHTSRHRCHIPPSIHPLLFWKKLVPVERLQQKRHIMELVNDLLRDDGVQNFADLLRQFVSTFTPQERILYERVGRPFSSLRNTLRSSLAHSSVC